MILLLKKLKIKIVHKSIKTWLKYIQGKNNYPSKLVTNLCL